MELNTAGYRAFRDQYIDTGVEVLEILQESFSPDFQNRNTSQVWDVSNYEAYSIAKWVGNTLADRSLHEITMVNNSNKDVTIEVASSYTIPDEPTSTTEGYPTIFIPAGKTAYFYCTAILFNNNLIFEMRKGSQDNRDL